MQITNLLFILLFTNKFSRSGFRKKFQRKRRTLVFFDRSKITRSMNRWYFSYVILWVKLNLNMFKLVFQLLTCKYDRLMSICRFTVLSVPKLFSPKKTSRWYLFTTIHRKKLTSLCSKFYVTGTLSITLSCVKWCLCSCKLGAKASAH